MPPLTEHPSRTRNRILLMGDSGSGKTGALASLVKAGYKLRIQDYDNNLDVLTKFLTPEEYATVEYVTLTDKLKSLSTGTVVPDGTPNAIQRGQNLLDKWHYWHNAETNELVTKEPPKEVRSDWTEYDLGPVHSWSSDEILVIDSLTFHGHAAMRRELNINNRSHTRAQRQDWGAAMDLQERTLQILEQDRYACQVIVNSHVKYVELDDNTRRPYPSALGSALPPNVGTYFNAMLLMDVRGTGSSVKRTIKTVPHQSFPLKNPDPHRVPAELDISDGLAKYFKIVLENTGSHLSIVLK